MKFVDTDFSNPMILVGFMLIMAVTAFSFLAVYDQGKKVWRTRSADLVPYPSYMALLGLFAITSWYGLHNKLLALAISGPPRILVTIYLLWGMLRYKSISRTEISLGIVIAILAIAAAHPFFTTLSLAVIFAIFIWYLARVPWKMWKTQKRGAVSLKTQKHSIIFQGIWVLYGFINRDFLIVSISTIGILIPAITIVVWKSIQESEKED